MRWKNRRRSSNVEDRRGMRPAGGLRLGGGLGTIVIILLALYFGIDPTPLLQNVPTSSAPTQTVPAGIPQDDPTAEFVAVVLADTEDIWTQLFRSLGLPLYEQPKLVLFSGSVRSACGNGQRCRGTVLLPPAIARSISIYLSLRTCRIASVHPAILRKLM